MDGGVSLDFLANLTRHTKAVNVVRFSPDGNFLATGSDGKYYLVMLDILSCFILIKFYSYSSLNIFALI